MHANIQQFRPLPIQNRSTSSRHCKMLLGYGSGTDA